MNTEWQQFLQSQGAVLDAQGLPAFTDAPLLPDCALSALVDQGLIRASGEDAQSFLQGQLTNDIKLINPERTHVSGYCSPKGRMLALFRVFQHGDDLFLMLPRERLEPVLKRLSMFVLRSKVKLSDASDELVVAGIAGDCAPALLPVAPEGDNSGAAADGLTVLRLPGDRARFLVVGEPATVQGWWQQASSQATPAGQDCWPLLEIRAGLPSVVDATAEAFVPQMTNMQLVNGVSFTKGCYTGQEVVARMQYLGTLKRRMYRVHIASDDCPAPGTELFSPSSASGQGAGKVVDARPSPLGGCEALVVCQISSMDAGDLRLQDADGPELSLADLPYAFESKEQAG